MAEEKSIRINTKASEEFLKNLDARPAERTQFIYQAIIVSLFAHIFILFITHQLTEDRPMAPEQVLMPIDMDMIEPEQIQQLQERPETQSALRNEELRNVVANEHGARTNEVTNYRGMTQDQINEQVYNDLKALEAEEFARLNEGKPDFTVPKRGEDKSNQSQRSNKNDWYKKGSDKSTTQPVSASFSMSGRDLNHQPLPTYRCKTPGRVVMNVTINPLGQVTDVRIDEAQSTLNECLRSESEKYARMWSFDYKEGAKKQDGTITFTFNAQ